MLMHAKYLEELKILDTEILLSHPRIPSAVAALTSLKSISFPELNEAASKILQESRSPLAKVEIGFWTDQTIGPGDPAPLLFRFAHSLRELRVTYAEFSRQDVLYPQLDTLVIDDCRFALARPIIACFPNTRDLSLWTGQEDEDLEVEEIEEHRQTNIQAQETIRWECIQHLRGDIRSLYLLGLTCRVEHLDVHSAFLTSIRSDQLSTLLSDGRPSMLSIRIRVPIFDRAVVQRALRPVRDSLTRLIVYINFFEETDLEAQDQANSFIDALSRALDQSAITHLVVHLSSHDPEADPLILLDPERLAEAALRHGPSVQYIALVDHNGQPAKSWEVVPGTRTLLVLDAAEALRRLAQAQE
ncbi:hypothetical protein EIP86_010696 [Pleurotus ostreatoroseus]|nr:hypothetical protein EIP86_010696 [Pleurotus ostreatoroseus]